MNLPDILKAEVAGKTILVRGDLDVPLTEFRVQNSEFRIDDDTRIVAGFPTVDYLLKSGATVILIGHLGRPEGKVQAEYSLEPIAKWYSQVFSIRYLVFSIGEFSGWKIGEKLVVLENLRFYPGEESKDSSFVQKLSWLGDIYVNDAFAASHRDHASIVGIPKLLHHFAGLQLQKEIESLSKITDNPQKPCIVIIGGKKLETKLPLVQKMLEIADFVLVGGLIAKEIEEHHPIYNAKLKLARQNKDATDIAQVSTDEFVRVISQAKTIVWNGSMGKLSSKFKVQSSKLDQEDTEEGTRRIAQAIIKSRAYSVTGGGDTIEFLQKEGLFDKFNFVSTGGGAMLSFLAGEKLPGIEALLQ